ncbi:uncharacterized protein LOC144706291 [Wolffia australiana]
MGSISKARRAAAELSHLTSPPHLSSLPSSFTVTPPVHPWPTHLTSARLSSLLRRHAHDPHLALRIFHHASALHRPPFAPPYPSFLALFRALSAHPPSFLDRAFALLLSAAPSLRCGESAPILAIRAFGLAHRPGAALRAFLHIRPSLRVRTSVRSLNALLNALIQCRQYAAAAIVFRRSAARFGVLPNVCSFNILLKALCSLGQLPAAHHLFDEMPLLGLSPNVVSHTTLLRGYAAAGDLPAALNLFRGLPHPDPPAVSAVVHALCRHGRITEAARLMDDLPDPPIAAYSAVVSALSVSGRPREALGLLREAAARGRLPRGRVCADVVEGLCHGGYVAEAYAAWTWLVGQGVEADVAGAGGLVYWLCREGRMNETGEVLGRLEGCCVVGLMTYNVVLAGLCERGELQEAGRVWDRMERRGERGNGFSYGVLIRGFCRAGKAREALELVGEMAEAGFRLDDVSKEEVVAGLGGGADERDLVEQIVSKVGKSA